MKKKIIGLLMSIILLFQFILHNGPVVNAEQQDDIPMVIKAQMINNRDIELYWDREVTGADNEGYFSVAVNGKENKIYSYSWGSYYTEKGIVYYNPKSSMNPDGADSPKTSIRLTDPVPDPDNLPEIKVTIEGNRIRSKAGVYANAQTVSVDAYEPFYQQEITMECGVRILGTKNVMPDAMTTAGAMLEVILANEDIAQRMGNAGCMLGIYGNGEIAYDIPEHRFDYDEDYLYVEGFGGTQLASIKDSNVLRITTGSHRTGYVDESILTHEFAHTVKNYGLTSSQQRELDNIYRSAINSGKWANSYAGSNADEYFATLSAMWFNAMDDTWNGQWDGVRGPINTRNELKVYDNAAYVFLSKIYVSDMYLPYPWENGSVPNNYVYPGSEVTEPTQAPTVAPTQAPTGTPKPTQTVTPTAAPTETPKPTQAVTPTAAPTEMPKPTQAVTPTAAPTETPEPTPTLTPTEAPTETPTETPESMPAPTRAPTETPTPTPAQANTTWPADIVDAVPNPTKEPVKWEKPVLQKTKILSIRVEKGKKVLIKIKKVKEAQGYRITYSKDPKFRRSVKKRVITSRKCIIKKLKKGTYYFRVEPFRKDLNGNRIYREVCRSKKAVLK